MKKRDRSAYALAIAGVGVALVVTIVGASTIAALGHGVPKELWAIGGALSGALVGILVPAPRLAGSREATPSAAAYGTHNAAVGAARRKTSEIERSFGATGDEAGAARDALRTIEECRGQLKAKLGSMAIATSLGESGQAHDAAAAAVGLQQGVLKDAEQAAAAAPGDAGLAAAVTVHEAAHEAASQAAPTTSQRSAGWLAGVKAIFTEAKILVPLILFMVALGVGVLLGLGVIHAVVCPHSLTSFARHGSALKELEKQGCYYATTTKQAANALIALASAAGGALLGVFATSPTTAAGASKTG